MIQLRTATRYDSDLILQLNNDPAVRSVSLNRGYIRPAQHRHWFAAKLLDPRCWLYVIEEHGESVGFIRLDDDAADNFATISIAIAPAARGRGLGPWAIREVCDRHGRRRPSCRVVAWILDENAPSQSSFARAGFQKLTTRLFDDRKWQIYARTARAIADAGTEERSVR